MIFRGVAFGLAALCAAAGISAAAAGECPGNPGALGTSRVLYVDPADHQRIGSAQYRETLPLAPGEVVLTFDDGPLPNTTRVLDILKAECIRATFFSVGAMASAHAAILRRAYDEGHSIGSHSQNHPLNLSHLAPDAAWQEMQNGVASVTKALGPSRPIMPFLRFPALNRTNDLETRALAGGLMVWSTDIYADDWMRITPEEVARRPLERLHQAGRGMLLLHDIQARTAAALPQLIAGLKQGGYKIVHVAPAGAGGAKTETAAADWHAIDRTRLGLPAKMQPVNHPK